MTETPRSEEVFGIAKKFHLELEKLPLQSHGAVVSMLGTMAQHREFSLKAERAAAEERAREGAMAQAKAAHDDVIARQNARHEQQAQRFEQDAKESGLIIAR